VLSPQSQSFFRRYGSILPTSLTYVVPFETTLLTLDTSCGYGYDRARNGRPSSRFSRARAGVPDAATSAALCQAAVPSRRANRFQGAVPVKKKRQLFPGPARASLESFASPRSAASRCENVNPLLFRRSAPGVARPCVPFGMRLRID